MTKQGIYKNPSYNLRIEKDKKIKMQIIAETKNISLRKLYEDIITTYIEEYEKENGTIEISDINEGGGTRN